MITVSKGGVAIKKGLFWLLLILHLGTPSQAQMCIQSLNTFGPIYAPNVESRTVKLLELLSRDKSCDLYLFQEVWRDFHISHLQGGMNNILNPGFFIHGDSLLEGSKTGLLTASVDPFVHVYSALFSVYPNGAGDWIREQAGVRKGFTSQIIEVNEGSHTQDVMVINTHLHHSSQAIRLAQIIELGMWLENLTDINNLPLVVAGDFNFVPESLEWNFIRAFLKVKDSHLYLNSTYSDADWTYDAKNPLHLGGGSRVIDYIFFKGGKDSYLMPTDSLIFPKKYKGSVLSDHYGRRVELALHKGKDPKPIDQQAEFLVFEEAWQVLSKKRSKKFGPALRELEAKMKEVTNYSTTKGLEGLILHGHLTTY